MQLTDSIEKEAIEKWKADGKDISTKELRLALSQEDKQALISWLFSRFAQITGIRVSIF